MCNELIKKANMIQTIDTSDLVKKANYNTKIEDIIKKTPNHGKYATNEFHKLTREHFAERPN